MIEKVEVLPWMTGSGATWVSKKGLQSQQGDAHPYFVERDEKRWWDVPTPRGGDSSHGGVAGTRATNTHDEMLTFFHLVPFQETPLVVLR